MQGAVDVSEKVLGALTGTSYVEGRPGKLHEYVPATAQWVQQQIKNAAQFKDGGSMLTLKQGENEQTLAFQVGGNHVKGFMLRSKVSTDEGNYQFRNVPAGTYSISFKGRNGYQDTTVTNIKVDSMKVVTVPTVKLHK